MSAIESITLELHKLSPLELGQVAEFIRQLQPVPLLDEQRRAALMALSGCMAGPEGEDFERAVRACSEQIDPWPDVNW